MKHLLLATTFATALTSFSAEAAVKQDVTFESAGQTLAGHLYLPNNYEPEHGFQPLLSPVHG